MGRFFCKRDSSGRLSGAAAVAASVALLLVTGCGGDPPEQSSTDERRDVEQSVPESHKESDMPSPSPTPESTDSSPTAMPTSKAAVRQQLHDATVHFYDTVDQAFITGDVAAIQELRHRNAWPSGFVQNLRKLQREDQRAESRVNYGIDDFSIKRHGDDKTVDAFFTLSSDAGAIVDAQGNEVRSFEAGSSKTKVTFKREGSEWLVYRIAEQ